MLNGDGGLTDGWVDDKLINGTRKLSFYKMVGIAGNRTNVQSIRKGVVKRSSRRSSLSKMAEPNQE